MATAGGKKKLRLMGPGLPVCMSGVFYFATSLGLLPSLGCPEHIMGARKYFGQEGTDLGSCGPCGFMVWGAVAQR